MKLYPGAMADGKSPDGSVDRLGSPGAGAGRVLCVGGVVVDRTYRADRPVRPGTSNPVSGSRGFGGVAGNVAANLARLGIAASLVSMVGEDESGRALLRHAQALGIDTRGIGLRPAETTAEYIALLGPDGELELGMADMGVFDRLDPAHVLPHADALSARDWIFADCNPPPETLCALMDRRRRGVARLAVDVVSTPKAERLPRSLEGLDLLFLNRDEAAALLQTRSSDLRAEDAVAGLLRRGAGAVVLTLGADGLVTGDAASPPTWVPAAATDVVDVTGAGDALVGATLAVLAAGRDLAAACRWGALAAALTLSQAGSTHPALSFARLAGMAGMAGPSGPSAPTMEEPE